MNTFNTYLEKVGEIGYVEQILHSLVYASGLPNAHPGELVVFETGHLGQVLSISRDQLEILLLTSEEVAVGEKVARTNKYLQVPVGLGLLGKVVDPLGKIIFGSQDIKNLQLMPVDTDPPKILDRRQVEKPLETGVTIVDLVIPLSKGQRELIIGDRKTGKTEFIQQTIITQAKQGCVCIYAVIGQKQVDIKKLSEFFEEKGIVKNTVIVASSSSDAPGLIFLTPYTAMTVAESFRDQGMDVLLILDDMTTHARNYREISLLARRFPGRSSYPGDIFYIQAKIIERAGNFPKGSITLLPVAESLLGDLSGYIQTNLMAMTDGHIFFDISLFNQGKRPAINPFLSVTRVGHQTQTPLQRDVSRNLSSFLVSYERMKQFLHFGAEVGETAKNVLSLGERVDAFFNQSTTATIPINANIIILAGLFAGIWSDSKIPDLMGELEAVLLSYQTNDSFKKQVDEYLGKIGTFEDLVNTLRRNPEIITSKIGRVT